jgi:Ca2+/Na+ antiporter
VSSDNIFSSGVIKISSCTSSSVSDVIGSSIFSLGIGFGASFFIGIRGLRSARYSFLNILLGFLLIKSAMLLGSTALSGIKPDPAQNVILSFICDMRSLYLSLLILLTSSSRTSQ